jgi:sulfatase maturation enzyme AslB (radical SAM superfamily)
MFYDNAILNEFEIANKDIVLKSKPRSMWIATSSKCNINCQMCRANDINWSLSNKNIKDIYFYLPYLERIVWWGGEPTISKTFYNMLSYSLKYKNIKHTIITNGQYMPKKLIDIISDNNIEVVFSIDSVDKKRYENIRKGASFDKLTENLSKLSKTIDNNFIKINVVAMKDTVKEFNKIINFIKKYNIKAVSFIPLCGDKMVSDKLSGADINIINKISDNNKNLKIFHSVNMLKNDIGKYKAKGFCHIPWGDITFSYMGFLCNDNNCSFFGAKHYKLTKDNMSSYWNSSISVDMRKRILKNHYCSKYCPKVSRNIL